ncbi:MAG: hypothetical protein JWL94_606 [Microbacteriaceae bacterium]|jgi:uncharacterized membrane protein YgaE (UPF0421/DUF939 family)|nr:hypothetical protein [Microbacteriaceae bacterium]HEV7957428.1 FUSC family protein [Marisediminicola sp.]
MRQFASFRAATRSPLLQVLKTSVAAIVAWLLSTLLLQQPLPIFAAIAALLVVQPSVNQSLAKGVERSIGVVLGVVLAYGAGLLFGSATWVVLAVIVVSLLLAWALKLTPGSSNQIPISAMLVLAIGPQSSAYAIDRILETIIGAVVGLIINALIVPPVLVAPARLAVGRLTAGVASCLESIASALTTPQGAGELDVLLERARELRPQHVKARADLDDAEESLSFNPRAGRHRRAIDQDRELLERLSTLVTRTIGMARAVHDNYDASLGTDPVVGRIAEELGRAAHDLRLMAKAVGASGPSSVRNANDAERPVTADIPALTAPLVIAKPDPRHWILVGSLMEDIRRVREEIMGGPED